MAILSWGKCKLQHSDSTDGTPGSNWTDWDCPKEDTTQLTPTAGNETTANEEGGDIIDVRYGKTTYELTFTLFVKKGSTRPVEDTDGVISGEHAFRIIPEDEACEGIQIDRCKLRVEENFTTADGKTLVYTAKVLKPATGKSVKPYTAGA